MRANRISAWRGLAPLAVLLLAALACSPLAADPTATPGTATLYKDDFSNSDSGWGVGTDDTGSLQYEDGQYRFSMTQSKYFTWGNLAEETFTNIRVITEVENKSNTTEPTFGVICQYQDENNFYYAGFGSDGFYAIVRSEGGEDTVLTDMSEGNWLQSDDIAVEADRYDLEVECANGEIKLVVDGKTIATVQDDTFTSGQIGLFVLTWDEPTADVRFDNLRVLEAE